jgi:hypothetical protein
MMFGLDQKIATLGSGEAFLVVAVIAVLLGLRHASDPDHLTAVTTLVAGDHPDPRRARRLGLLWGAGHATSLIVFGIPIVLYRAYLPEALQTAAEFAVGLVIVALALRLLVRRHRHDSRPTRSPAGAYGIGVVHGMGGSAGVGVLLLSGIPDHVEAVAALILFATFTAVSMSMASMSFGYALSRDAVVRRVAPMAFGLGCLSLAFGIWYSLGALHAVPYGL